MKKFNFNIDVNNADFGTLSKSALKNKFQAYEYIYANNFVDLGFPSKTIWMKYNLGANIIKMNDKSLATSKDYEGKYYAWGEIESKKGQYSWDNYKHKETVRGSNNVNKYLKDHVQLELEDDAAYMNNPFTKINTPNSIQICIPTEDQIDELLKFTSSNIIRNYNDIEFLYVMEFTSHVNGNKLIIPFTEVKSMGNEKAMCGLWSSTKDRINSRSAASLWFTYAGQVFKLNQLRYYGLNIRPVLFK